MPDTSLLVFVALAYLLAGTVKGIIGLGLPTVSIGLLSLVMPPAQAAALMVIPSYATNTWQMLHGPYFLSCLRRFWSLYLGSVAGAFTTAGILTNEQSGTAATALGLALAAYAVFGLSAVRFHVPRRAETWLSPVIGVATGAVLGATGVFVMPAIPYLQALELDRDEFVQAMGLSFTVGTVILTAVLLFNGVFVLAVAGLSAFAVLPAVVGMVIGRRIRARVDAATFRKLFFIGMLVLGLNLAARSFY
ncbi:sulfite exporter TauE/SafE family protein [Microbaculum marinum]|uniref:Probable membrane transporter protein n=1 Tax=Microbaculum marinum TaxID=1764581 RepID=A0AAW9RFY8_9HYPH